MSPTDQKLDAILEKLDILSEVVIGNGEPEKGLLVRLTRVEEREKGRDWWVKGSATAALGALGIWALEKFKGRG